MKINQEESNRGTNEELPLAKRLKGHASEIEINDASHYDFLWTIHSFSRLAKRNEVDHHSGTFMAKSYTWQTGLYSMGTGNDNHCFSFKLRLLDTPSMPSNSKFRVKYRLSLFDQIGGKHLTHKGVNYYSKHDAYGFRAFISLDTFMDASNGYLVDDACIFGVEIFTVIPCQTTRESLHALESIGHEYTWKIRKFSKVNKETYHEKSFLAGGYKWCICIYPNGDSESKNSHLSLYFVYSGPVDGSTSWSLYVECTLRLIDQIRGNHVTNTYTHVHTTTSRDWGYSQFIPLKDFHDTSRGFLVNDTCKIEACFTVLGLVK